MYPKSATCSRLGLLTRRFGRVRRSLAEKAESTRSLGAACRIGHAERSTTTSKWIILRLRTCLPWRSQFSPKESRRLSSTVVLDLRLSEACSYVYDMVGCDRSDELNGVLSSSNSIPLITACYLRTAASDRAVRGEDLTACGSMECIKAR